MKRSHSVVWTVLSLFALFFSLPGVSRAENSAVSGTAAATTSAVEDKASKEEDIRHLLDITGASKMGQQVMATMIANFKQTMPDAPANFWDQFAKEIDMDELTEKIIPIYDKHLSQEDIRAAIAFYESPAGRRMIASQPLILQESMAVGMEWGRELSQRAVEKIKTQKKNSHGL